MSGYGKHISDVMHSLCKGPEGQSVLRRCAVQGWVGVSEVGLEGTRGRTVGAEAGGEQGEV